jgi:hypothetical protein
MTKNDSFKTLEYFLNCYFSQTADFNELSHLGSEYKKAETNERIRQLKSELESFVANDNWKLLQEFISRYGMRNLSILEVKEFINTLVPILVLD